MENTLGKSLRELRCLYDIARITGSTHITLQERLLEIVSIIPKALQYPEIAFASISVNGNNFKTENYCETDLTLAADILVRGAKAGSVVVGYARPPAASPDGLFSKEERLLLDAIAERLGAITEHRQAEEALQESEAKFYLAFNASPDIMAISKMADGEFAEVNESFTSFTGYSKAELIGHTAGELMLLPFKEDSEKIRQALEEKGRVRVEEVRLRKKSGGIYPVLFSAEPLTIGGEKYLLTTSTDISEQRQSQELVQTISDVSPLGIYILQDDRLKFTNPRFQKITGYSQRELADRELLSLVAAEDSDIVKSSTAFTLQAQSPYPCEYRILSKNGQIKWVMQTVSPIRYEGKTGILGNLMDITERKYLERKVIEYEELSKMKSDLLATVSHKLRTPLTTIKGYSTMILDYYERLGTEETREYLRSIDASTDRLTKLVDNLLDTSRMEAGLLKLEKAPASVTRLIQAVAAEASARSGQHHIITRLPRRLPIINIDAKRIWQVLDNLIDNAVKFSPPGTEITMTADKARDAIVIRVIDNGPGINAGELAHIFERMYRIEQKVYTGTDGIGLGLYICQKLVEGHGGRIWAESTPGKGSIFAFTLPVTGTGKNRQTPARTPETSGGKAR